MLNTKLFGERLRAARKNKGASPAELAHLLNITPSMYYKYETGSSLPGIEALLLIADYLSCSAIHLLCLEMADLNPKAGKILSIYNRVNPKEQEAIMMMVLGIGSHSFHKELYKD